ncbi:MAG TPA: hypothetical protein VIM19_13335 [Actinomycetes bacterium]
MTAPDSATFPSMPPAPRRGARRYLVLAGALLIVVAAGAILVPPWIFHIGGRSTPGMSWDGVGTVRATDGGTYVLSTHLVGGPLGVTRSGGMACSDRGCDTLHGTARLCTKSGTTYTFQLRGAVHAWWSTNGAATSVDLTNGTTALPDGWVVAFHGSWHGPQLVLSSPDNSFTEVFTPAGAIRTTTSTADAGGATVTLDHGSATEFARECRALTSGRT